MIVREDQAFRDRIVRMGGYDVSEMGKVVGTI